jgi:uncharacterized membrane protein YkoI
VESCIPTGVLSGESQFIPLYCWSSVRYRWFGDEICLPQGAKMKTARANFAAASAIAIGLAASPVSADPLDDILYPADANGILPAERILDQARHSVAGTILEIELEQEHGRLIYEVLILTADNRMVEIEYDAKTGSELTREFKKSKPKRGY